jgi:hypothetical protein
MLPEAVNACLVLGGVRAAARLEYCVKPAAGKPRRAITRTMGSHFMKELRRLCDEEDSGLDIIAAYEPIIYITALVSPNDVGIVREEFPHSRDFSEPLCGAMGMLLQYPAYHDGDDKRVMVTLYVTICSQGPEGSHRSRDSIAGFSCPSARVSDILEQKMREWVAPADALLSGCEVVIGAWTYQVAAFDLEVTNVRHKTQ